MIYFNNLLQKGNKILIFGKNGQLGMSFNAYLGNNPNVLQLSSKEVDFLKPYHIPKIVKDFRPNIIINTSAYTNVEQAEVDKEKAYLINGEAVRIIAESAKMLNSVFIHYSTDYIFDGKTKSKYKPKDRPNPLNIYGKSKLKGEQYIFKSDCNFIIFRISWLMSEYGENFLKKIIRKIKNGENLFVINEQFGSPISSKLVTEITAKTLLLNDNLIYKKVFHLSTKGSVSWYDIASYIFEKIKTPRHSLKITPIKSDKFESNVARPKNSLFDHSDIEKVLNEKLPFWKDDITPIIKNLFNNIK